MATHTKKHTQHMGNRELIIKGKNQDYATITKLIGNGQFECTLLNGTCKTAKIPGKFRAPGKKTLIALNNFVLIEKYVDNTECDLYYIIHKYEGDHKQKLQKQGQLDTFQVQSKNAGTNDTNIIMQGETINQVNELEIDSNFIDGI